MAEESSQGNMRQERSLVLSHLLGDLEFAGISGFRWPEEKHRKYPEMEAQTS